MTKVVYPSSLPYPFAKAVRAGDFVFISGQLPFGPDGTMVHGPIEVQTRQVLENIKATLEETGCTLADVVKNMIWLEEERDFGGFNKIYAEYFGDNPPARATVGSVLMLDAKIEVETLAYKPLKG
ncbi:MAG: RidA family protein [Gammaproteobacteria bacterium]|jgi:reactive intermediate/imine deaminase|nr:RidA family protein [Gammaproteobacteria bacterium]